jgi:diguanylate cyclase (GGDEF)-like protein
MHNTYLKELMSTDLVTVDIMATLDDVIALMRTHVYSCIIVVDCNKPAGIITERDLVRVLADLLVLKHQETLFVKDLMSRPAVCIAESDTLYEALVLTQTRAIRHLPVVNSDGELVGLITQTDIAQAHFTTVERHREIIEQEIRDRTQHVINANKELKALALQDSLLAIGNRRAMEVDIHFTHANAERYGREYCCVLLDIDYFKDYNDHYGHQAGDETLIRVSNSIKGSLRSSDRLYRFGGEEFLVLMPDTSLFESVQAVHRVLENLERLRLPHNKSLFQIVTLSAGIGCVLNKPAWQYVVKEADAFLYDAKEFGRNQVCWNVDGAKQTTSDDSRPHH